MIKVLYNPGRKKQEEVLRNFYFSIDGDREFESTFDFEFEKCDLVVLWGLGNKQRGSNARKKSDITDFCKENDIPFVVFELGHFDRENNYSVTINGYGNSSQYLHNNINPYRYKSRNIEFEPFSWSGKKIIICKQLVRDNNVDISEKKYDKFIERCEFDAKMVYNYDVVIREHPENEKPAKSLNEELDDCRFLMTYSSNSANEALLKGVPFYVCSRNHLAVNLSTAIDDIDNIGVIDKLNKRQEDTVNRISYAQWGLDEMGDCFKHLKRVLGWD